MPQSDPLQEGRPTLKEIVPGGLVWDEPLPRNIFAMFFAMVRALAMNSMASGPKVRFCIVTIPVGRETWGFPRVQSF